MDPEYDGMDMGTHIRVTDDVKERLDREKPDGQTYDDVLRDVLDGVGDRDGPVRHA